MVEDGQICGTYAADDKYQHVMLGYGTYRRVLTLFVAGRLVDGEIRGGSIYQIRLTVHSEKLSGAGRPELSTGATADILRCATDGIERTFEHVPYEDETFRFAAGEGLRRWWQTYDGKFGGTISEINLVMANGDLEPVNTSLLRGVDFMRVVGPVWCPVANVVEEHPSGPGGREIQRGMKQLAPGTRVYCLNEWWSTDRVRVVGRHRKTHRFVTVIVNLKWLTDWRAQLVYSPTVASRLWPRWDGTLNAHQETLKKIEMLRQLQAELGVPAEVVQ